MTFIKIALVVLSVNKLNINILSVIRYAEFQNDECCYAEFQCAVLILGIIMLCFISLCVVMLSFILIVYAECHHTECICGVLLC